MSIATDLDRIVLVAEQVATSHVRIAQWAFVELAISMRRSLGQRARRHLRTWQREYGR